MSFANRPDGMRRRAGTAVLAVLLGAAAGIFVSGYWLTDLLPPASRQLLLVTILVAGAAALGFYRLLPAIREGLVHGSWSRTLSIFILGAALGVFAFLAGTSRWAFANPYVSFLLPRHQFHLEAIGAPEGTSLLWLSTDLGDISYGSLTLQGWERQQDRIVLKSSGPNSIEWSSITGESTLLVFQGNGPGGEIRLAWEGGETSVTLRDRRTVLEQTFAVPFYASARIVTLSGVLVFCLLALWIVVLAQGRLGAALEAEVPPADSSPRSHLGNEVLIVLLASVIGLVPRVINLASLFPAVDEYYHLIAARQILGGMPLDSVYQRGLWIVTLPVALALRIFGHEVWAARAVGAVFNVLAVIPLYMVTRRMGRPIAAMACFLYATSPWVITFARVAREYAYYPFYFYWIILAMVMLVEAIPQGTVLAVDWRRLLRPRVLGVIALLALPPVFALKVDWLSTFRTILIAYLVLGVFVLMRLDWRDRRNWVFLMLAVAVLVVGAYAWFKEQETKLLLTPRLNVVPLEYFFPNPQQQWYFLRVVVAPALAVALAVMGAIVIRWRNWIPLFFVSLFLSYLAVFSLVSKSFFHTRHLMSTQFWYVIVLAIGAWWLWRMIRRLLPARSRVAIAALAVALALLTVNPAQILLPALSRDPDMPISEDYMHDMSAVHAYITQKANQRDALIATVYGLYTQWEGEPQFAATYRITSHTTMDEIGALASRHASGWLVMDTIRLDLSALSVRAITDMPQMEYIGVFDDEHVWRWGSPTAAPGGVSYEPQQWIYR